MNKNRLLGPGRRPGGWGRPPTIEQVTSRIVRGIEAVKKGRALGDAQIERDRREWAGRCGGG